MSTEIMKGDAPGSLAAWGDEEMVRKVAARLRAMLPNTDRVTDGQLMALAQRALVEGKSPFKGELYVGDQIGVVEGYRGLQRDARPVRFHARRRLMTADERAEHGLADGDIGAVCELWVFDNVERCKALGIPYEPTIGIGVVTEDEMWDRHPWKQTSSGKSYKDRSALLPREQWKRIPPPVGRSWAWRAKLRAYADALRGFGLPYVDDEEVAELRARAQASGLVIPPDADAEIVARLAEQSASLAERREEFRQELAALEPEEQEAAIAEAVAQASEDLFGPPPEPHWIDNPETRKAFWAFVKAKGLTTDEAREALGVERVHDFTGSRADARRLIEEYAARKFAAATAAANGQAALPMQEEGADSTAI